MKERTVEGVCGMASGSCGCSFINVSMFAPLENLFADGQTCDI